MSATQLQQISARVAGSRAARAEALLNLAGAVAVTLDDGGGDTSLFEPAVGETPLWPTVELRGMFPMKYDLTAVAALLRECIDPALEIVIAPVPSSDWKAGLEQHIAPLDIGKRLRLAPAEHVRVDGARVLVRLHMGVAFGTGQHPTTQLCLEWLDRKRLGGLDVLDYGCGSGVLALAALSLGARRAWATDADPQAVAATRRNAALNGLETALWCGPIDRLPATRPDLILANILARTLIDYAPRFRGLIADDGRIVLSGILDAQTDSVIGAYEPDFSDFAVESRQGWSMITARRAR
jgi:ribosomal protein L11 methyltransferase